MIGRSGPATKLAKAEKVIPYAFKDADLLSRALTHSSHAYESQPGSPMDNELLEFLGVPILTPPSVSSPETTPMPMRSRPDCLRSIARSAKAVSSSTSPTRTSTWRSSAR